MITVEPVVLLVRHHPDPEAKFGDPWDFTCLALVNGNEAFLKGGAGKFSRETGREIVEALEKLGIDVFKYERHKG